MSLYGRQHNRPRTIPASIETTALEDTNQFGETTHQVGVRATCNTCGHETTAFGTGPESRRRCLALLREECPMGERNWYEED